MLGAMLQPTPRPIPKGGGGGVSSSRRSEGAGALGDTIVADVHVPPSFSHPVRFTVPCGSPISGEVQFVLPAAGTRLTLIPGRMGIALALNDAKPSKAPHPSASEASIDLRMIALRERACSPESCARGGEVRPRSAVRKHFTCQPVID